MHFCVCNKQIIWVLTKLLTVQAEKKHAIIINSVSLHSPVSNHSFLLLFWLHRVQSQLTLHLLYSAPWPSCCLHRSGQIQNCQVWKSGRMVQNVRNPLCLVPSRPEWHVGHICHQMLHCNTHLFFLTADQSLRGMPQWDQFHVRLRLFPKTEKIK